MKPASLSEFLMKGRLEAGVDEAGRGCLAGPVTAAAVIPGPAGMGWLAAGLDDSKRLSLAARDALREQIEKEALAWAVGWATVEEIERVNILQATYLAMHRAIDGLGAAPAHLLIDGNRFRPHEIDHTLNFFSFGAGFNLGYQWLADNGLSVETYFGPMFRSVNRTFDFAALPSSDMQDVAEDAVVD